MNFIGRLFSSAPSVSALPIKETPLPLAYVLSSFRWHMDSRPPTKVILVHDFLSSSASWQQLLHENIGRLPLSSLTPKTPVEFYAVDLRGHGYSKSVPCPTDGLGYTLASAADIVLHQQQILRSDAKLVGLGFGALVACQAALHSPESGFDSLTLFVNNPLQLEMCEPSRYCIRSAIEETPKGIKDLSELNQHLRKTVPNEVERALLLSLAEQHDNTVSFRVNEKVLKLCGPLQGATEIADSVKFSKEVTVVHCGEQDFPQEAIERFSLRFPKAKLVRFEGNQSAGIGGLYAQGGAPFAHALLDAMGMLGSVEEYFDAAEDVEH